jgi:class 3 adenylate cyclase/tetratricopeptide (TPR) repeat protein
LAESIELATILLTDLVGSTRLSNSVGPVRADQLREEHFELLRDAITPSGGSEIKNTGDGLMVAFSSASAAVECAAAMQQRFERRYRNAEQALHVRIGLSAGESTVKDGDYFGTPSIMAARLCAQAPTDGILVCGMVRALAGRCERIEFASAGDLALEGFHEPVEAFSVSWTPLVEEADAPSRWPLPVLLRSVPPLAYVGRIEERAALEEAMTLARSEQRQVVLLSGEPGIGKTRLASYAAHQAHAEGLAVAWGACTEELAVPYEPWIGMCSHLVEHAPEGLLERHVKRHGGELGRLARNLSERVAELPELQSSDPETERYLLFAAVAGFASEVAESVPLCVVLDDLHWADGQSVALLKHVVRTVEQGPLQVIATYRDSDLGKDHPLSAVLADLRAVEGVQRIALHGLGADEVAQLMASMAGHELEEDALELAAQIASETDGNPFFVGEILRGLSESGALVFDETSGRWSIDHSAAIALPESVREVIERRVERLGEEALEVLRVAAVIGRAFDLELLSRAVEAREDELLDNLDAAVAASVLSESSEQVGRFRFAHALINQTLYEGIGATRRARMHQRVAETLEEVYGADPADHLSELALHWRLAAVSVQKIKAADYARRAGERALESLAPDEALKLFSDALELTDEAQRNERCDVLIGLGEAQRQVGSVEHRQTLLDAAALARELGDADRLCRAVLANTRGYVSKVGVVDVERAQMLEAAADALSDEDARRARVISLLALELHFSSDPARVRWLAAEGLEIARAAEDPVVLAYTLSNVVWAIWGPDALKERKSLTEQLLALARRLDDPKLSFWAAVRQWDVGWEAGDRTQAESALATMRTLAAAVPEPTFAWQRLFYEAVPALAEGDLQAAEQWAIEAFEAGTASDQPDAFDIIAVQLFNVRYLQGRTGELVEQLMQIVGQPDSMPAWRGAAAIALIESDRVDEARELILAEDFQSLPWDLVWPLGMSWRADACARLRLADRAGELYELLDSEDMSGQFVFIGAGVFGSIDYTQGSLSGTLGRYEQAEGHFAAAAEMEERLGAPLFLARTRTGWARALIARGRPEDTASAQQMLDQAEEVAQRLSAGLVTREVAECRAALAALSK